MYETKINIFKMETIPRLQTKIIIWKQLLKKNMLEFSCAIDSSWKYRSMRKYYFSSLYSGNVYMYISILASLQIEVIGEFYKFSLQPSLNISSSFMSGFFSLPLNFLVTRTYLFVWCLKVVYSNLWYDFDAWNVKLSIFFSFLYRNFLS